MDTKRFEIKIYSIGKADYIGTFNVISDYRFNANINGGLGELRLTLPLKLEDLDIGGALNYCNHIEIWVRDTDTASDGVLLYTGFIADFFPTLAGSNQYTEVIVWGYGTRLAMSAYRNAYTLKITKTGVDPQAVIKDIIDQYRTNYSDPMIDYTESPSPESITALGSNIDLVFNSMTCTEAIEKTRENTGSGWWWHVGADLIMQYKPKPSTATHKFVRGKDFSNMTWGFQSSKIKNELLLSNGLQADDTNYISKYFYNTASKSAYFGRFEKKQETAITESTQADTFGEAFINAKKDPNKYVKITLKDNNFGKGYDIESVKCGQTFKLENVPDNLQFSDNILITGIEYSPRELTVYGEDLEALTSRVLETIQRTLEELQMGDGPEDATATSV